MDTLIILFLPLEGVWDMNEKWKLQDTVDKKTLCKVPFNR